MWRRKYSLLSETVFWDIHYYCLAITAFLTFDMLLVKIFLSPTAAGEYALLSLVGKMIYFVGALFSQFITPMVSKEEGAGRDSEPVFYN